MLQAKQHPIMPQITSEPFWSLGGMTLQWKRVHVYSSFTFIERMILDSYTITVYKVVYNSLSKVSLHHRMPAKTKGDVCKAYVTEERPRSYFEAHSPCRLSLVEQIIHSYSYSYVKKNHVSDIFISCAFFFVAAC